MLVKPWYKQVWPWILISLPVFGLLALSLPVSGWWLVNLAGFPLGQTWLLASSVLFGVLVLIGLLLNTVRRLPQAEAWLREGRWVREGAFPLTPLSLRGRKAGIVKGMTGGIVQLLKAAGVTALRDINELDEG